MVTIIIKKKSTLDILVYAYDYNKIDEYHLDSHHVCVI